MNVPQCLCAFVNAPQLCSCIGNCKGLRNIFQSAPEEELVFAVRIQTDALEGTAVPTKIAMMVMSCSVCVML